MLNFFLINCSKITFPPDLGVTVWMTASTAKVPLPCTGTAVQSSLLTPDSEEKFKISMKIFGQWL